MEKNPLHTELILPNDPGVLPLARNYVGELAIMAQLPQEQS